MRRVCTGSQLVSAGSANAAVSTPGHFNTAPPGLGVTPTVPGPDWFEIMQEEVMSVLTAASISPDNTGANSAQLLAAILAIKSRTNEAWLTSGTSFTVPAPSLKVTIYGAGGGSGGGDYAGGGGGGEIAALHLTGLTIGSTLAYTLGAGGVAGSAGVNGGSGGATTFNSVVANGGAGGTFGNTSTVGVGGAGGTGGAGSAFQRLPGGNGNGGVNIASGVGPGGNGGANGLGQAGGVNKDALSAGTAGGLPGTGASGGANGSAGAVGASGAVHIEW